MEKKPTIWALLDDRAGNVSQCLGVAEALELPFVQKDIQYNSLAKLPNFLLGASLRGLSPESRAQLKAPWPDLVIAAGRRTAPVARYIKKASKGQTRLVQIMHPGSAGAADFDLICVPAHDQNSFASNEMTMLGAPHRVTPEKLEEAAQRWRFAFKDLSGPKIALIVGGATKNREFSVDMGRELAQQVNTLALKEQASVLVTTSRRTGADVAKVIMDEITVASYKFQWGAQGENPYFGFLSSADLFVVTGDSVSMCSECCATGKPVYIYAPDTMIAPKHKRMVRSLIDGGYAFAFGQENGVHTSNRLNAAGKIAAKIREDLLGLTISQE